MTRCFNCGRPVPDNETMHKITKETSRSGDGKFTHHADILVCEQCNKNHWNLEQSKSLGCLVLVGIVIWFIWGITHSGSKKTENKFQAVTLKSGNFFIKPDNKRPSARTFKVGDTIELSRTPGFKYYYQIKPIDSSLDLYVLKSDVKLIS